MHQILALFSFWTLFSVDILGVSFYPSYLLIPLYIFKAYYPKYITKIIIIIIPVYVFALASKFYLIADVVKLGIMITYFLYLNSFFDKDKLLNIIDISVIILVLFGLSQYVSFLVGNLGYVTWLHEVIGTGKEELGAAFDLRGGILRVASFTREPSYFAFTVGVYFFITKRIFIKLVCVLGYILSFSLVSLYAVIGLLGFYCFRFLFKTKYSLLIYTMLIVLIQILFVKYFLDAYVPDYLYQTFSDRYSGLKEFTSSSNLIEILTGIYGTTLSDVDSVAVIRSYSNISSLAVNFGLYGIFVYIYFIHKLGRYNESAALSIFLYGFNFYYLTGWPTFVIFVYLLYAQSSSFSDYPLFQLRKNYYQSTEFSEKSDLSSS
ncbi:hypothetical protein H6G41_01855 [Tolypothrix sp. FACHB-123]|uniref:hypothetical protein n=1 Tax=Tolypothrix sp. FACHB-123 TaxID=2692868 RepID=UPI0016879FC5|nr:hypothetical protein [Tolypothrix sp. FACHB-123]MBD2353377.1 hypothetical protein [Tolypothrix sp. FACHB-123]